VTIFRFFQDGGHPPSWICEGHLVVFITDQYLIATDAPSFNILGVRLENAYSRPQIGLSGI